MKRSDSRTPTPVAELLESRCLLSVSLDTAGLLTVSGTPLGDAIVISLTAGKVQVREL